MRILLPFFSCLLLLSCQKSTFEAGKKDVPPNVNSEDVVEQPGEQSNINPVDIVATESSIPTDQLFVECLVGPVEGVYPMKALLYQLPVDTQFLPDFTTLTPLKKVCLRQLDISARSFSQGFPGVADLFEWFALDIRFKLMVPADGDYTFFINSDDGSKLFIDGNLVIDNDGQHAPEELSAIVPLTAGAHEVKVEYFQGPRFQIALELFWQSDVYAKDYIPQEFIRLTDDPVFDQIVE